MLRMMPLDPPYKFRRNGNRDETAKAEAAPPLRSMWPALLGGLTLALPGLLPPLWLEWGTDAATARAANEIYVYERLPHHLNPWRFPLEQLVPFFVLCLLLLVWGRGPAGRAGTAAARLRGRQPRAGCDRHGPEPVGFLGPADGRRAAAVLLVPAGRRGCAHRRGPAGGAPGSPP